MSYRSNVTAMAIMAVVSIGIVGCGGGSSTSSTPPAATEPEAPALPAYMQPVTLDEETSTAAVASLADAGDVGGLDASDSASLKNITKKLEDLKITDAAFPEGSREDDSESISLTLDCAYDGNYTIEAESGYDDIDGLSRRWETTKLTFNNCIHDEEMLYGMVGIDAEAMIAYDTYKYSYNGVVSFDMEYIRDYESDIRQSHDGWSMDNFVMSMTDEEGKVSYTAEGDFTAMFERYDANNVERYSLAFDGTWQDIYNGDEASHSETYTGENYTQNYSRSYLGDVREESDVINGYIHVVEDDNTTEGVDVDLFEYGEDFKIVEIRTYLTDEDTNETYSEYTYSYNGVYSNSCIGGAVTFTTDAANVWKVDERLESIMWVDSSDANRSDDDTAYTGMTALTGANNTSANISFDMDDDNRTFAIINVNGVDSDPKAMSQIEEEANCTMDSYR